MKRFFCALAVTLLLVTSTPWAAAGKMPADGENAVFEDFRAMLLLVNQRYALVDAALQAVQDYGQHPDPLALAQAKKACARAAGEIPTLPLPAPALGAEHRALLKEMGILEDFLTPFRYEPYYRESDLSTLMLLRCFLESASQTQVEIVEVTRLTLMLRRDERQIEYMSVNSFANSFSTEAARAFREDFLPDLTPFSSDGLPWISDDQELAAAVEEVFSRYENTLGDYEAFVGECYLALLREQEAFRQRLLDAGYTQQEADACLAALQ